MEIVDITRNSFSRCQLSYFSQVNNPLHRCYSLFRFTLSLSGDINVKPSPTTESINKTLLNIFPFYHYDEPTNYAI